MTGKPIFSLPQLSSPAFYFTKNQRRIAGYTRGHLQTSLQWSPRLSRWLNDAVNCEHARRQMRATRVPSLDIVNGWSNREVVGALGLACMWNDAAVDGLTGQFSQKLRNAVIAVVTGRLLDAEDANKNTKGESCSS